MFKWIRLILTFLFLYTTTALFRLTKQRINDIANHLDDPFHDLADVATGRKMTLADDFEKNSKEFVYETGWKILTAFHEGYDNFLKCQHPDTDFQSDYLKAYKNSDYLKINKPFRFKIFARNYKKLKEIEGKTESFRLDETSKFMFMSEEEKHDYVGLGNLTELEQELERDLVPNSGRRRHPRRKGRKSCGTYEALCEQFHRSDKKRKRRKGISSQTGVQLEKRNKNRRKVGSNKKLDLAESLDLRDLNIVTPVKDQRDCQSCWAFGAIAALEGAFAMATGFLKDFSEQQVINCNSKFGCNGGYWTRAWKEIKRDRFIALEKDQPYKAKREKRKCDRTTSNGLTDIMTIGNFQVLRKENREETMLGLLATDGPVTICMKANNVLYLYRSGVIDLCMGGKRGVDHLVVLIGYEKNFLIIKNSWGQDWGEDGYFRLVRGCGRIRKGYSYWASYLSVVSKAPNLLNPLSAERGNLMEETFRFGKDGGNVQQLIQDISDIGVKEGDVLTLKLLRSVRLTRSSKFMLDFLNTEDGMSRAYRLQFTRHFKQNGVFICRQVAPKAGQPGVLYQKFMKCTLSAGGVVEVMLTSSGFSVNFDGLNLQQFPYQMDPDRINQIKVEVKGPQPLFKSLKLIRRKLQQNTASGIKLCFDKDQYCKVYIEEDPGSCLAEQTSQWMQMNCPESCGACLKN